MYVGRSTSYADFRVRKLTIVSFRRTVAEFVRGALFSVEGLQRARRSAKAQSCSKKLLGAQIVCCVAAIFLGTAAYWIIWLVASIIQFVLPIDIMHVFAESSTSIAIFCIWQVPFISLFVVRYGFFESSDEVFFDVLHEADPVMLVSLQSMPVDSFLDSLKSSIRRMARMICMMLSVAIFSRFPNPIGPGVVALAGCYSSWRRLGPLGFVILFPLSYWGFTRPLVTLIVQYWLLAREWRYEFFASWLLRQGYSALRDKDSLIMGYSLISTVCLSVPFVGPLLWFYVIGGSALLVPYF